MRTEAKATVTLVMEIDLPDRWTGDCPMAQVFAQAASEAERTVRLALAQKPEVLDRVRLLRVERTELEVAQEPNS